MRSSPASKSIDLPSASSTATPLGAATMSSERPIAATLTASGMGRSMSITSCPASRAPLTRSTRSGVRSSSQVRTAKSSPFMGRCRGAPEGLFITPPHSWGGGAKRRRGSSCQLLPIHGEVARSAGGALHNSSPFMGRWREAPEGLFITPPHSWGGGAKRRRGSSSPFFDVLARSAQQRPLEVVAHQDAARLQQLVEGLQQLALGGFGLAAFGLDALPHVAVEEIDGLPRGSVHGCRVLFAELHQRAKGHACSDELHAGGDRLQVVGGVERLGHAASFGELG